jgi:type II secretory pathway component PulJ
VTTRTAQSRRTRCADSPEARRAEAGFTLIEMLAVVGFSAVLMLFAVNFYVEITRASEAATAQTRGSRRAAAILDRIARDLEATVLVKKPEELDPLSHPWVFLAEDRGGAEGAERLKFVTRGRILRSAALHESDLEVVAYVAREAEDRGLELLRWSSPRLPEELDRSFPAGEVDGAVRFAEGLASFGVVFMDDSSQWKSEWDSSTLADSSQLPLAAEISLAMLPEGDSVQEKSPRLYQLRVLLPVRPLDLQALLDPGAGAGGEDEEEEELDDECVATVGECITRNPEAFDALRAARPDLGPVIDSIQDQCYADYASTFDIPVGGCE